jgi:hypothetical protein
MDMTKAAEPFSIVDLKTIAVKCACAAERNEIGNRGVRISVVGPILYGDTGGHRYDVIMRYVPIVARDAGHPDLGSTRWECVVGLVAQMASVG